MPPSPWKGPLSIYMHLRIQGFTPHVWAAYRNLTGFQTSYAVTKSSLNINVLTLSTVLCQKPCTSIKGISKTHFWAEGRKSFVQCPAYIHIAYIHIFLFPLHKSLRPKNVKRLWFSLWGKPTFFFFCDSNAFDTVKVLNKTMH